MDAAQDFKGFKPDNSPDDIQAELDFLYDELASLRERKEQLEREQKEEEVRHEVEEALRDRIQRELRKEHDADLEQARDDAAQEAREEAWEEALALLARYGRHQEGCYAGFVQGQGLDPFCTCGWNEVATAVERRRWEG